MDSCAGVSMSVVRLARAVAATVFGAFLFIICTSCGETYRPVAFPIPPSPPNPGASNSVFVLTGNGTQDAGTMSRIDVSGDSYLNAVTLGRAPIHAALVPSGSALYSANNLDNTVSANSVSSSGTGTGITISLPSGSAPVFVATTESSRIYVANFGVGTVSAINTATNVVSTTISVDPARANDPDYNAVTPDTVSEPVALAETPDGKRLYAANRGGGFLTSINTVDFTRNPPISIGGTPVSVVARSDSAAVFALESTSGTVYAIDPTTIPEQAPKAVPTAAGADFMSYDSKLNRLYVLKSGYVSATANSSGNALWVFDASISPSLNPPALLAGPISILPLAGSACGSGTPVPVSVAALPDESRIYVASYQISGSTICSQVNVLSTSGYATTKAISTGTTSIDATNATGCALARPAPPGANGPSGFRLSIAAAADLPTTRVYVANCDAGSTTIITTVPISAVGSQAAQSADTVVTSMVAPESSFAPLGGAQLPPPQNPVWVFSP
jgi:YVTN family beta-propeller protein